MIAHDPSVSSKAPRRESRRGTAFHAACCMLLCVATWPLATSATAAAGRATEPVAESNAIPTKLQLAALRSMGRHADSEYRIEADDSAAVYPVLIDPWVQGSTWEEEAELAASEISLAASGFGDPPTELWVARHEEDAGVATALDVSSDGSRMFVTGAVGGIPGFAGDLTTIAYHAATGDVLWLAQGFDGDSGFDAAKALDLSPDGSRVFVTGRSGFTEADIYLTVAYDATTGDVLWVAQYDGPGSVSGDLGGLALRVSPDGSRLFVTGGNAGADTDFDYATVAYDAANGDELWVAHYDGPASASDHARALTLSSDGSRVFVTGESAGELGDQDYATVAYDATTGDELWVTRYDASGGRDTPEALRVSPDGSRLIVTGWSVGTDTDEDYATIAYDVNTGDELWVTRYDGFGSWDFAQALGVNPDGSRVFVTGTSTTGGPSGNDYATIAYDSSSGNELWVTRYNGPAGHSDDAQALDISPDGTWVVVAGDSFGDVERDYTTIWYDAATGDEMWVTRYDGPSQGWDQPSAVGVGPNGSRVFVTGASPGIGGESNYTTVSYNVVSADRELAIIPDLLDFGEVPVGETSSPLSLTLTSVGTGEVTVNDVTAPDSPFQRMGGTCGTAPFTLPPETSCTLDYAFVPMAEGLAESMVTITSDAPSSPDAVTLRGSGTVLPPALDVQPESLSTTLQQEQTEVQPLTLSNLGQEVLDWEITEEGVSSSSLPSPTPAGDVVDCEEEPGIIVHDDGTIETAYSGNPDTVNEVVFIDHFTPNDYRAFVRSVCVAFHTSNLPPGPSSLDFEVVVFADDGPDGSPGTELGALAVTATDIPSTGTEPTWHAYDISSLGITIDSGSVYIGARWEPSSPNVFLAADQSPPNPVGFAGGQVAFLDSNGDGDWQPTESIFPNYRAMFIRAAAEILPFECTLPAWASADPTNGSVAGGDNQMIDVTFDSTGLEPGDYEANLCLSSNDPERPLVVVPLALTVTAPPAPELAFDPSSLDLGGVPVGETSAPQIATLQNVGDFEAAELSFNVPGSGFDSDISACGDTLPAGGSCEVSITFTPTELGSVSATLEANSANGTFASLSLIGNGIELGVFTPVAIEVDPEPVVSDGNGIFEPNEFVDVTPTWRNDGKLPHSLTGTASDFTGPDGASYMLSLDHANYGNVEPSQTASCLEAAICYRMGVNEPGVRSAPHWDATFEETLSDDTTRTWTLHIGDSFTDVPRSSLFYSSTEILLHHGVTGGCSDAEYCPAGTNTRSQMAVFLLRAVEGGDYEPPACKEGEERFLDVPASSIFCPWIEELAGRGVTSGCGDGKYCPSDSVTRAQMAIFLLRALEGEGYMPPTCTAEFTDVTCPSLFADWIEELAARGITSGCAADPPAYCPTKPVTRAQMATFVTRALGLTLLYEP